MLHHIAGEHEWIDGQCQHGPLVASETDKMYLDKNSKAFEAICKVVLVPLCYIQVNLKYMLLQRVYIITKRKKILITLY